MLKTIKTVLYTLMSVFIVATIAGVLYAYGEQKEQKAEIETQEIVDTLEKIINVTKPDFERANNQTFINSVGQCVNYIYNTTTDVIPVNFEVLLAQAALESGWGNSRFALEGKNLFGIRTYNLTEPHMLPSNNPKKWGVRVYMHECDSVQHYIDILNTGGAYEGIFSEGVPYQVYALNSKIEVYLQKPGQGGGSYFISGATNGDIGDNGVVKIIEDDNYNGAGELNVTKTLYAFDQDPDYENRIKFLRDLCLDIGLSLGNKHDSKRLRVDLYKKPKDMSLMTKKELETSIMAAERLLQKYKKELEKYES